MYTIWVEASAGSGKTTFLINKIKEKNQIIKSENEVEEKNILFLTFSNAAANEMANRLGISKINCSTIHAFAYKIIRELFLEHSIIQNSFMKEAIIETFKDEEFLKLAKWLLNEDPKFDIEEEIALFKGKDKQETKQSEIRNDLKESNITEKEGLKIGIPKIIECENPYKISYKNLDKEVLKNFELLSKDEIISKKEMEEIKDIFFNKKGELRSKSKLQIENKAEKENLTDWALKRIQIHEKYTQQYIQWIKQTILNSIANEETKLKNEEKGFYYEDLIELATKILANEANSNIFLKYFGNIKLLLIDEAQDLSKSQWKLIYTILKEWSILDFTLIIASDPKQLIYEFQGASINTFVEYKNKIKELSAKFEEKKLEITYRLPKKICEFVNQISEHIEINYGEHIAFNNQEGEIEIIKINKIEEIIDIIKKENYKENEIMILFKQRTERIQNLARAIMQNGLLLNSPLILNHPIIKDFQHLINWLYKKDPFSLGIIFNAFGEYKQSEEELLKKEEIKFLERLNILNLEDLFIEWYQYPKVKEHAQKKLQDSYYFWIEVLRKYAEFYKYNFQEAISDKNNFYATASEIFSQGIFLNTIHSAKGKEAELVILCDTDFKSKFKNDTERLLYVGLTRARRKLIIPMMNDKLDETWAEILNTTKKQFDDK